MVASGEARMVPGPASSIPGKGLLMQQNQRAIFLAVLTSAIFASASPAQTTLRYQFKEGEKIAYLMEQKMKMSMNIMGNNVETQMIMTLDMSWNVLKVDSQGVGQVQIKVGSAKVIMDGPTGKVEVDSKDTKEPDDAVAKVFSQIAKAMAVMEITGSMQPTGEMKEVKVSEETAKALKNLPGADKLGDALNPDSFKNMITTVVFPKEEISKGKTWTNKTESKTPVGKTIADNTYTYDGQADKDGVKLDKISVKPMVKIEADPSAPIKIEVKDAKGSGEILFDNKTGRLVESVIQSRTDMAITANGLNLTQVIDQTVTIRVKKK
jgi:hypothetical protein